MRTPFVRFFPSGLAQVGGQFGKERGGGHHQAHVAVPAMPGARLAVIEAKVVLGALETFLDGPAQTGGPGQFGQCRTGGAEDEVMRASPESYR